MRTLNDYGYYAALQTAMRVFEDASRGTGRTTRMCRLVERGDVVIVPNSRVSRNVQHVLRGLEIEARVLTIEDPSRLFEQTAGLMGTGMNAHFDHTWIEQHALEAIRNSEHSLRAAFERANILGRA